jgi:hypothetical protein
MSRSILKNIRDASILIASLVLRGHAADGHARLDDYIVRAEQFVRTFYPLVDGHVVIRDLQPFHPLPGGVGPDVIGTFDVELDHPEGAPSPISVYFSFDWRSKHLSILSAIGPDVTAEYDAFVKKVEQNTTWSNAEIAMALSEAGAKFGPDHKDDFVRWLPLKELRLYVGELKVVSVDFIPRDSEASEGQSASLFWAVRANSRDSKGSRSSYLLTFEPFEGRIVSISRMPRLAPN